jgi:hypothetical protein
MRGKIRDKHAKGKGGFSSKEENVQRHPYKRESRAALWIPDDAEDEENYDFSEDEMEENEEMQAQLKR